MISAASLSYSNADSNQVGSLFAYELTKFGQRCRPLAAETSGLQFVTNRMAAACDPLLVKLESPLMTRLNLLAGAFLLLGAASAHAQTAPAEAPASPPPGGPGGGMMHGPMGGRGGYMGMHRPPMMMMMKKSAAFRFKKDGAEIDIRCAADEPTKACVDAAGVLIDKLATLKTTP